MSENNPVGCWDFTGRAKEEYKIVIGDPENFLERNYDEGYNSQRAQLQRHGTYKYMGWEYDFRPFMNRYLVKMYGDWSEYWAPSEELLRRSMYDFERDGIEEIYQLPTEAK